MAAFLMRQHINNTLKRALMRQRSPKAQMNAMTINAAKGMLIAHGMMFRAKRDMAMYASLMR